MLKTASKPVDVQDLHFKLQCRLKVFNKEDGKFQRNTSLVACANRYGLVFVGCSSVLKVYRFENIEDTSSTKATTNCPRRELNLNLQPYHISVNCDDTILAVIIEKNECLTVIFYDVLSFYREQIVVLNEIRLTSTPGVEVLQCNWHPTINNIFTECKSDGTLGLYELKDKSFDVKKLPAESRASCFCWSPKGKQIAVGSQNGKIIHYKPDLKAVKSIDAPPFERPHSIISLQWISNYQFVGIFKMLEESDQECCVVLIDAPKTGNTVFTNFYDICYSSGNLRQPQYYIITEQHWNILLVASANGMEVAVMSGSGETWTQWILPDSSRAELPLDENQDETFPLGMALVTSSTKPVLWGESYIQPAPSLILLSHEGILCSFRMINLKDGAPSVNSPPEKINDMSGLKYFISPNVEEIKNEQVVVSNENRQLPTVTELPSPSQTNQNVTVQPSSAPVFSSSPSALSSYRPMPTTPLSTTTTPKQSFPTNLFGNDITITPVRNKNAQQPPTSTAAMGTALLSNILPSESANQFINQNPAQRKEPMTSSLPPEHRLAPAQALGIQNKSTPPKLPISMVNLTQTNSTTNTYREVVENESQDIELMLTKMIEMECSALDEEVRNLIMQGQYLRINISNDEMDQIVFQTEGIKEFLNELVETCEIQSSEIHTLKQTSLQCWAWLEEARSRYEENQNIELKGLLKSKPLDSVSEKHLSSLKQMQFYLNSQLTQCHKSLDDQWEKFQDFCRKTNRVQLPTMEAIFQTMVKQNAVLQKHNYILKDITSQVKGKMKASNQAALFNPLDKKDNPIPSFHNLKLEPENIYHIYHQKVLKRVKSLPANKVNHLRRMLHNRDVPHVSVKSQMSTSLLNTSLKFENSALKTPTGRRKESGMTRDPGLSPLNITSAPQISSTPLSAFVNKNVPTGKAESTSRFRTELQGTLLSSTQKFNAENNDRQLTIQEQIPSLRTSSKDIGGNYLGTKNVASLPTSELFSSVPITTSKNQYHVQTSQPFVSTVQSISSVNSQATGANLPISKINVSIPNTLSTASSIFSFLTPKPMSASSGQLLGRNTSINTSSNFSSPQNTFHFGAPSTNNGVSSFNKSGGNTLKSLITEANIGEVLKTTTSNTAVTSLLQATRTSVSIAPGSGTVSTTGSSSPAATTANRTSLFNSSTNKGPSTLQSAFASSATLSSNVVSVAAAAGKSESTSNNTISIIGNRVQPLSSNNTVVGSSNGFFTSKSTVASSIPAQITTASIFGTQVTSSSTIGSSATQKVDIVRQTLGTSPTVSSSSDSSLLSQMLDTTTTKASFPPTTSIFGASISSSGTTFTSTISSQPPSVPSSDSSSLKSTPSALFGSLVGNSVFASSQSPSVTSSSTTTIGNSSTSIFGSPPTNNSGIFGQIQPVSVPATASTFVTTTSSSNFSSLASTGGDIFSAVVPNQQISAASTGTGPVTTTSSIFRSSASNSEGIFSAAVPGQPISASSIGSGSVANTSSSIFGSTASSSGSIFSAAVSNQPITASSTGGGSVTSTSSPIFGSSTSGSIFSAAVSSQPISAPSTATISVASTSSLTFGSSSISGTSTSNSGGSLISSAPSSKPASSTSSSMINSSGGGIFGGAVQSTTCTSTASTSASIFGSSGTSGSLFGTTVLAAPTGSSSVPSSSSSIFGSSVSNSGSIFATSTQGVSVSNSSIFGSSASSSGTISTSGKSIFGSPPTLFGASGPGTTPSFSTTTTSSPFGAPPFSATSGNSIFGNVTTSSSLFGNKATFGSTSEASSPFGATVTSSTSFGGATNSRSVFGQASPFVASSTVTSSFGSAPTNAQSPFGGTSSPFGNTTPVVCSPFGSKQTFGTGFNAENANTQASSPFGQASVFGTTSSGSAFGAFTQSKSTEGSFGFGSLNVGGANQGPFSKSEENKSPFSGPTFNPPASSGSLFGSPTFGNSNVGGGLFRQSAFGGDSSFGSAQQSAGPFSVGGGSIAQTGFGVSQQNQPKTSAFGAAPTFGGSPAFGAAPTFGGAPAFGSTSPFGGASKVFGSPTSTSGGNLFGSYSQQSSGFGSFGSQSSMGFGNLGQQSNTASENPQQGTGFGTFASQNTIGFGNLAQQTNGSGQSAFSGNSSFSSWR